MVIQIGVTFFEMFNSKLDACDIVANKANRFVHFCYILSSLKLLRNAASNVRLIFRYIILLVLGILFVNYIASVIFVNHFLLNYFY